MKTAHICFLWHMHQPYYTDAVSGSASMPWVRLHATKAYFDMAFLLERFPTIRATVNFTPSLLLQLMELASGSVRDLFLEHTQRPATNLTPAERAFIIRHFFAANWATMVRPYPRYHELLVKRGPEVKGQDLDRLARPFTTQDLLDLQVWFNLAWFGYGTVARYPRLAALRVKDRGFTEDDKREVLALQQEAIRDIIPFYRRLAESGQIELTTSPFYHPILPLLIDTDFAKRSRPETALPQRFQAPADAETQIHKAVAFHTELFGRPPAGLWPSEGSVCPEMVPMLRRAGLRWMATDEGILARSLNHWNRASDLYQPYRVGPPVDEVAIVFRDRELSDAFGFVYAKTMSESAVEDVLRRFAHIVQHTPSDHLLIPIILDGENPWEHYHDGGERFLSRLYTELAKGSLRSLDGVRVSTETISRSLEVAPPGARLEHLHSGSWINQDFKIWAGHQEDNRAWDLLQHTRARLVELSSGLSPNQAREAWEALYAAEGSDWFWWYGDDFETDYKSEFDRLFRTHLRNVFTRAGAPAPEILNEPIIDLDALHEPDPVRLPVSLLSPTIDGLVSDFFEWRGAGAIDPNPPRGSMWKSHGFFTAIEFGCSLDALFLRLDPDDDALTDQTGLAVELHVLTTTSSHKLAFALAAPGPDSFTLSSAPAGQSFSAVGSYHTICRRKILELAVPFKDLNLQAREEFRMYVVVTQHGLETERYPRHHAVVLKVPDQNYEAIMWRV
ncbi:MAG TPA: glycoside hydrolase family 57 protein [Nitrospiraceae bacterium]|nr:glycoside hydrolase family 57 protein [Nitrospiraceae bacterium]